MQNKYVLDDDVMWKRNERQGAENVETVYMTYLLVSYQRNGKTIFFP